MNTYKLILLLTSTILLLTISSCIDSSKKKEITYQNGGVLSEYSQTISTVDTLFFSHFPRSLERDEFIAYNFSARNDMSGHAKAWVVLRKSEEEIEILSKIYESNYHNIFDAANSNLLVINTWKSLKESGFSVSRDEKTMKRLEEAGKSEYPILNFYELNLDGEEKTRSQLSSDFKIIVFRAEKGIFGTFDELSDRNYVPKIWNHGFSKGIAISKQQKIVIYWVAIW